MAPNNKRLDFSDVLKLQRWNTQTIYNGCVNLLCSPEFTADRACVV
jgi:hypothetical protein